MTTLFVNACIRGEKSRTLALCREYVNGLKQKGARVREVNLEQLKLAYLSEQKVAFRSQLTSAGLYEDEIYDLAHQFAEADDIVIGAPYWDLSFPAALKTYIEHISVEGITFHYTPDAHYEGLCRAERITYITTAGSLLTECDSDGACDDAAADNAEADQTSAEKALHPAPGKNLGYDYVCAIARMFGIPEVRYVAAEGLDIAGIDIDAQLGRARTRIAALLAQDEQ